MDEATTSRSDRSRFEQLESMMAGMLERIAGLEAENRDLRASKPAASEKAPAANEERTGHGPMSRRGLLLGGAGMAAVGAVAIVGSATPAAAAGPLQGDSSNATPAVRGDQAGTGYAVYGYSTGTQTAGKFDIVNTASGAAAIDAYTNGTGTVVYAHTDGTGRAGEFRSDNSSSSTEALFAFTNGTGPAVYAATVGDGPAVNAYTNDVGPAVNAFADGIGPGVHGTSTNGNAGLFEITNSSSDVTSVVASTAGTGPAVQAGGPMTGLMVQSSRTHIAFNTYAGNAPAAPPSTNVARAAGELTFDANRDLWLCVTSGTPGTWRKVSGPATAGAFHVLPAPARIYDSRPGTFPSQGPKTPLVANTARTLDLTVNNSNVPPGATAALVTILLVNAYIGNGNFTVWANGAAKPLANSMVWGGNTQRFSSTAVTALDADAKVQVLASAKTDLVLDVVGYYR